jgi:monofunctional glycosyltransferase
MGGYDAAPVDHYPVRRFVLSRAPASMTFAQRVTKAVSGRQVLRFLLVMGVALAAVSIGWIALYRLVPPPGTPLMLIRMAGGAGFDWASMRQAWQGNLAGGQLRGGSTISMQTAKNAWLWQDRTYLRKGLEAWFTLWMELLWPKARVMEVYLNIIEWGDGIYGAEAASQTFFGKPASALTRREAALMAAVLPNPLRWSPAKPTRYIASRANLIQQRMMIVTRDGLAACVG